MQVKNIESIQYFHDKFDVIDYPQKYLNFETHSTYLAEFEDCMVHTWPFLITNMGGLISEHVWPLTWKQKNKLGPRQGIYPKWGENVDINIPLPSQEFTDTNKFVWLPIDISSGNNPWHIWIDVIAKMRLLEKRLNKPFKDFVYIMPHRSEYMEKIITEIMPEIKLVVMPKDSTWKFKHIYVPTMCNHNDGVIIPQSVNFIRSRFLHKKIKPPHRKIFIDRGTGSRKLSNKEEIFAILKGWEVLRLEEMPVLDQMIAFAEATHVVGTHGAGLVNLLWCLPETKVIEIVHKHTAKKVYPNLSHLLGLNHKVLMGECVPIPKTTHEKTFKRLNDYNDIKLDSSILLRNLE
jgi:hypothetical protein|tara:strand:- start:213 stop:1256 length:1044 start_codon:yes stop_codon:yes gene_type:complete